MPIVARACAVRYFLAMSGPLNTTHPGASRLEDLQRPVQFLRGVGPRRAELLHRLGIHTVADVLFFFPRNYESYRHLDSLDDLQEGESATVTGTVVDCQEWHAASGTHVMAVLVEHPAGGQLRGIWFNQKWMARRFAAGQPVMFEGTAAIEGGRWQMVHPKTTWFESGGIPESGSILPVYSLTGGIQQRRMREIVAAVVDEFSAQVDEVLPEEFREEHDLCGIQQAIRQIHGPDNETLLATARHRFVFQELLVLQLALAMRRSRLRSEPTAPRLPLDPQVRARILRRFPFELSESQLAAADEIAADMRSGIPMNRLLHGEVGSGKTAVATFAILLAVAHGYQAVLMAPTELLARQHVRTLQQWLSGGRVRIEAWTGSQSAAHRESLSREIAEGRIQIVVGTHALLSSPPPWPNLGLVVIDEQHKFGVRQRAGLRQAGCNPHYLVMTATPIPRTISMTAFGDLDVSELRKPAWRDHPVHTYLGSAETRESWWEFVRQKLREGRQAFVVAPLIRSDDDEGTSSAESMLEALANGPLEEFRLDLLHGRQKPAEKEAVMLGFSRGTTQVLVATSIVEVGVNVPNATVMTIESAERFGLSQLHQIRGRVSRGNHPGYVCVFPSGDNPESSERLQAFVNSEDGFALAEQDLLIRGPGNLFGDRQHGLPPLRIADVLRDGKLLQQARRDAQALIERDPQLADPDFAALQRMIVARYGAALEISDVG